METRALENAINFAINECRYEMSCLIVDGNMEGWNLLAEVKDLLQTAVDKLPF